MLSDAAGLAGNDIGVADRVEQRGLAVIDMAHDRHDRRTRHEILAGVRRIEEPFLDIGFGDPLHGVTEFLGDELRRIGVDHVGDLRHLALLHQKLDDIDAALRHPAGEFLDRDRLGQDHVACELFLNLVDMAFEPLNTAAESRDGPRALFFLLPGDIGDREAATAFLLGAPGRARDSNLDRQAGPANDVWRFLFLGRGRPATGAGEWLRGC